MKIALRLKRGTSRYKIFELKDKTIIHVINNGKRPRAVVIPSHEYRYAKVTLMARSGSSLHAIQESKDTTTIDIYKIRYKTYPPEFQRQVVIPKSEYRKNR